MLAYHSTSIVNSGSQVDGGSTTVRVEARWHVMNSGLINNCTVCCVSDNYIEYTPYTLELEPIFSKQEYEKLFGALQGDKDNRNCIFHGCLFWCCPCLLVTLCVPFVICNQRSAKAARENFLAAVDNITKFLADKGVKNTKNVSSSGLSSELMGVCASCNCAQLGQRSEYYVLWEIAVPNRIQQQPQQQQPVYMVMAAPGMTTGKPGEMMPVMIMPQGAMPMMVTQEVPPGYTQS